MANNPMANKWPAPKIMKARSRLKADNWPIANGVVWKLAICYLLDISYWLLAIKPQILTHTLTFVEAFVNILIPIANG
jgi:hypothetical protein